MDRVRRSTGRPGAQVDRARRSTGRSGVQVDRVRRSTGRSGVQVDRVRRSPDRSGVQVHGGRRSRHVKWRNCAALLEIGASPRGRWMPLPLTLSLFRVSAFALRCELMKSSSSIYLLPSTRQTD